VASEYTIKIANQIMDIVLTGSNEVTTVHSTYKHDGYKHTPFICMVFVQSRLKSVKCNGSKLRL